MSTFRNSHSQMFFKVGVLKNFANFTGKHLCWSLFLISLQDFRPACNFIKKRLLHRCFPVKFGKFLRTPIFTEHLQWLLLYFVKLETEFREVIHSWQINEITCMHKRIFSSYNLFIGVFFRFSTNWTKTSVK